MNSMKKKILVIDDETSITKLLKFALERSDRYVVQTQNEGKGALSAVRSFLPDIILLDVNLPDMSGGEIEAELQSDASLKGIPVVFLTGMVSQEEIQDGLTISGRPALAKPIDLEKLVDCVEKNLK
jgi:DNA-binding response OmpR family regulator